MGHFQSGGGILFCHEALDELNQDVHLALEEDHLVMEAQVGRKSRRGGAAVLDAGEGGAVFGVMGRSVEDDSMRRAMTYCWNFRRPPAGLSCSIAHFRQDVFL